MKCPSGHSFFPCNPQGRQAKPATSLTSESSASGPKPKSVTVEQKEAVVRALTAEEISSLYYASGVGMYEENYQKLSYYPNPASDELNIEAKEFSIGTKINLFYQMGRLLECKTVESELTKISMESLKAGHYHFRLTGKPKVYNVIKN